MKRFIIILLTCAMLVGCLASCNFGNTQPNAQPEPEPPATNDPIDYTKADDTPNMTISYDMSLVAELYLSLDGAEESEKIYLDQLDGQLTVGEVVFDRVSYGENVEVKFEGAYTCSDPQISVEYNGTVSGTEDEKAILTIMARITQQKNCYLLESSTDNEIAEYIAAYYFDGVCYLVLFNENGIAFRVYFMEVEYAELPLTDGMSLKATDIASYLGIFEYSVNLNVVDGQIYNYGHLYKIKYYNNIKINVEWCRENLHFWGIAQNEGLDLLDKINEEKGCYVIYSDESESYYEELAIFIIDGTYYFIDVTEAYRYGVCIMVMCRGVPLDEGK